MYRIHGLGKEEMSKQISTLTQTNLLVDQGDVGLVFAGDVLNESFWDFPGVADDDQKPMVTLIDRDY